MANSDQPILLATRGSALALTQTHMVLAECQAAFPDLTFAIKIIKTTGDKLQTAPAVQPGMDGTKGLFTKELEVALLNGEADLAIHSLKDLPTEVPEGLALCAVLPRADVRDVLIYREAAEMSGRAAGSNSGERDASRGSKRGLKAGARLGDFPTGSIIATSSTRRQAQLLAVRPDLKVVPIRGNVGTRLQKLADRDDLDGLILASAGLLRLGFTITPEGRLQREAAPDRKDPVPPHLLATWLSVEEMLPCVGQGAIGIEGRQGDVRLTPIFERLNHKNTWHCVTAERAFLQTMGGGCLSPVAAYGEVRGDQIRLRAVSFRQEPACRSDQSAPLHEAAQLGVRVAKDLQ